MISTTILLLSILTVTQANGPPGGGHGPGGWGPGPGGPPPWGPGRPGGPWVTAAPGPAPADPGCTARPACDLASASAKSCSSRAAATGAAIYSDCLCQPGPSAVIQECFAGCFGAGGPQWLAQCVPATVPVGGDSSSRAGPAPTGTGGGGGGGPVTTSRASGSGPIPTGSVPTSSRTGAGGPGPSGNGTAVPSRTSGAANSSLPPRPSVVNGAKGQLTGSLLTTVVGFLLAAQFIL